MEKEEEEVEESVYEERLKALQELADQAQELDMGY